MLILLLLNRFHFFFPPALRRNTTFATQNEMDTQRVFSLLFLDCLVLFRVLQRLANFHNT